jgi:hypothetical protein
MRDTCEDDQFVAKHTAYLGSDPIGFNAFLPVSLGWIENDHGWERIMLSNACGNTAHTFMSDTYTFFIAPALGCFTAISLVVVAYLIWLEIADRRRKRRMEEKLEQMDLSRRYRKPGRYLAGQKPRVIIMQPSHSGRLNLGQHFQKPDRSSGWNFSANNNQN